MHKSLSKAVNITVLFLLVSATRILPITIKSSIMVHPQQKKCVILLDDAHYSYLNMIANSQQQKDLLKLCRHQKLIFSTLGNNLLKLNPEKGGRVVVITETNDNTFGCMVEEEIGAARVRNTNETIEILPRIFLRNLCEDASTVDAKNKLLQGSIKPFNGIKTLSFTLHNNMRWVAGDRDRTQQDTYLAFGIYNNWEKIIKTLRSQEELPEELAELSIENVTEYLKKIHAVLEEHGIVDPFYQKISDVIDKVLASQKLQATDHFAVLHQYLVESQQNALRDELNNDVTSLISQKCDVELRMYVREFDKDQTLDCAFIIAGGEHNKQIREFLYSNGYIVSDRAGIDDAEKYIYAALQDKSKLSDLLDAIKRNFPFVNMQKIAGVNPQEIQEPKDTSYTKPLLKAASVLAGGLGAFCLWKNQRKPWAIASAIAGLLVAAVLPDSD